jgi:hypothetical protein
MVPIMARPPKTPPMIAPMLTGLLFCVSGVLVEDVVGPEKDELGGAEVNGGLFEIVVGEDVTLPGHKI